MKAQLTLKDIAKKAGVSEMTASRALRKAADVSEATRKKVEAAAQELGYVRNKIAGALSSQKIDLVGVIIPSVKSYVFSEVLDGISETLSAQGLRPVFGLTNYDLETETEVVSEMLSWRPRGLIIAGLEHSDQTRRILANTDTTIVEIMDTDGEPIQYCVGISHFHAGYQMAQTILGKGYKSIGFIGTKMEQDFRAAKRLKGFQQALTDNGQALVDWELYNSGSTPAKGKQYTKSLLERTPSIDCIYCSTDVTAMGAYLYCVENKISVPEGLALAGFNNLELTHGLSVELATTDSMRFEIGQKAAEIIVQRSEPQLKHETQTLFEMTPTVIAGNSL